MRGSRRPIRNGSRSIFCSHDARGEVISRRATGGAPSGAPQPAQNRAPALFTRPQRLQVTPSAGGAGLVTSGCWICGATVAGGGTIVAIAGAADYTGGGGAARAIGSKYG